MPQFVHTMEKQLLQRPEQHPGAEILNPLLLSVLKLLSTNNSHSTKPFASSLTESEHVIGDVERALPQRCSLPRAAPARHEAAVQQLAWLPGWKHLDGLRRMAGAAEPMLLCSLGRCLKTCVGLCTSKPGSERLGLHKLTPLPLLWVCRGSHPQAETQECPS